MDPEAIKLFWILTAVGSAGAVVYAVVAIVNLVTRKLEGAPAAGVEELEELRARADQVEYLEQRVAELETRVDFAERLLTTPQREAAPGQGEQQG